MIWIDTISLYSLDAMTLPWNLQLGQCHILNHCNHCLRSDEIRCYHFCLGTRYLELHSITRSGVVHCIRSPDNMNFPPHTTSPPPINGIKYQSFLHNYSSTDTSWVRHPIQVSPSSFHTYVPQMNTSRFPVGIVNTNLTSIPFSQELLAIPS